MNLIQDPALQRRLQRGFSMKETSPAPTLAPEIVPVAIVADLLTPEESETRRPAAARFNIAAGAGNRPYVALFNPTGSGLLVTVEGFIVTAAISSVGEAHVIPFFDTAGFGAISTMGFTDTRLSRTPNIAFPQVSLLTRDSPVIYASNFAFPVSTGVAGNRGVAPFIPYRAAIGEGGAFLLSVTINTTIDGGIIFTESQFPR